MRALILIVLLVVVAFVFASEHPLNKILKSSKDAFTSTISRKPKSRKPRSSKPIKSQKPKSRKPKSQKPKSRKPASRKPLKAKIATLQKKLAVLKKKLAEKKAAKSQKPRSRKPKSAKPRSSKPKSRKPRSSKPVKSQKPRSRKPRSSKPKSRKPASRKPRSSKPVKTLSDAAFWKKLSNWWKTKGKKIFSEENIDKAKKIYDILKQKKSQQEAAPEADSEQTVSCGQAYQSGQKLGEKQCVTIQGKPVVVETAQAFYKMEAAAKAAGITLQLNSGFRKMSEQEYLYNCYLTKKCNNGNLAARPGYSNHQNGKALDIAVANSAVFTWMRNNASKFGFVRTVPSENWHWELRNTKCNAFVSYTCQ